MRDQPQRHRGAGPGSTAKIRLVNRPDPAGYSSSREDFRVEQGINPPVQPSESATTPVSTEISLELSDSVQSTGLVYDEPPLESSTQESTVWVQARTRQSWDEAVQRVILPSEHSPWRREQLQALLRTDYYLCHQDSLEQLLQSILQEAVAAFNAQRGTIALAIDPSGGMRVEAVVVRHQSLKGQQGLSLTLARRCFERGESLLCQDVRSDADLESAHSVMRGSMSSILCALLRSPRQRLGVLHLDRGPLQGPFTPDDLYLADALAAKASVGIESAQLVRQQEDRFLQTLTTLARTVEARDRYTGSHTQRVTEYALCLAEAMQLPAEEIQRIRVGTPLHDIGKIAIADAILRKPGRLTPEEFEQMKLHPLKGVAILEGLPSLRPILPIVRSHHERWDGQGYPDGLTCERIAREARVVALGDVFDALTSDRPYRRGLSADAAFAEIERHVGAQFDPDCGRAFLAIRPRLEARLVAHRATGGSPWREATTAHDEA
jgi:HD-GYP domain-containing protein (c-di-GMP phosphodiesterase class II)